MYQKQISAEIYYKINNSDLIMRMLEMFENLKYKTSNKKRYYFIMKYIYICIKEERKREKLVEIKSTQILFFKYNFQMVCILCPCALI